MVEFLNYVADFAGNWFCILCFSKHYADNAKIPKEAFASASSFLGLMRFLGQSLSISILTTVMLTFKTSTPMRETLTVYLIIAVVGVTTAAISAHGKKT